MADDDERLLEEQLEIQLQEQRESLTAIKDALASDPNNTELLSVEGELVSAISDAEDALLNLKRARLLREADSVLQGSKSPPAEDVKLKPLNLTDVEAEPLEEQSYSVGSRCRFRHDNGRCYNGQIIAREDPRHVKVSFLTPTSENMSICKFFLQQRCRFGANCRLSHGISVPISCLKRYVPTIWDHSLLGSTILAASESKAGIWREAELESWDENLNEGQVVFCDDGSSQKLGIDAIAASDFPEISDQEESRSSYDDADSSEYEDDSPRGLGFVESTALQRGIQTETAIFAKWENHTRGIASKMMASMGYHEGMGLGVSGQGIVDPVHVKVLPPKQSLDHAVQSSQNEVDKDPQRKKRSRGGKRKRDKKFAEAARAAKQEEEPRQDVFSLINQQLAMNGEAMNGCSSSKKQKKKEERKEDRRSLIAYEDEMKELRLRLEKLEEMVNRNKKEKVVYEAAMRKLLETRKALAEAEAAHTSASHAVTSREKEKRWLKF